ncbi:AP2/ERF domain [Dillenia turbinata]|uniref:AP2/ERF domain n=1 Tax=Dillenia turbinata TaxID=194707 RepID=A0AAN8ZPG8_9MAGN
MCYGCSNLQDWAKSKVYGEREEIENEVVAERFKTGAGECTRDKLLGSSRPNASGLGPQHEEHSDEEEDVEEGVEPEGVCRIPENPPWPVLRITKSVSSMESVRNSRDGISLPILNGMPPDSSDHHFASQTYGSRSSQLQLNNNHPQPNQNAPNTRTKEGKGKGYNGVTRRRGRYQASIWGKLDENRPKKSIYIGTFKDEVEAARAYDLVAIKFYGAYACTNFPNLDYKDEVEKMKNMSIKDYLKTWSLHLGTFDSEEEAARAFDIGNLRFNGPYATTNFNIKEYDLRTIFNSEKLPIGEGASDKIKAKTFEELWLMHAKHDLLSMPKLPQLTKHKVEWFKYLDLISPGRRSSMIDKDNHAQMERDYPESVGSCTPKGCVSGNNIDLTVYDNQDCDQIIQIFPHNDDCVQKEIRAAERIAADDLDRLLAEDPLTFLGFADNGELEFDFTQQAPPPISNAVAAVGHDNVVPIPSNKNGTIVVMDGMLPTQCNNTAAEMGQHSTSVLLENDQEWDLEDFLSGLDNVDESAGDGCWNFD